MKPVFLRVLPIFVLSLVLSSPTVGQFHDGFGLPGFDHTVWQVAAYDDGNGEALFAYGSFSVVDEIPTGNIARWDGLAWSPVGNADLVSPPQYQGGDLIVFDDGGGPALYMVGYYGWIDGVGARHLARWDGVSWSSAGQDFEGYIDSPIVFGDSLYAVSSSDTIVYRWDGQSWTTELEVEPNSGGISQIAFYDDGSGAKLYIAGAFDEIDGVTYNSIARWDGTTLEPLTGPGGVGVTWQDGSPAVVQALGVYDPGTGERLYVGGDFARAGGVPAEDLASWDGASWGTAVSNPPAFRVNSLHVWNSPSGPVLAIGSSPAALQSTPNQVPGAVSTWDGITMTPLLTPDVPGELGGDLNWYVYDLASFDDGESEKLIAGGYFLHDRHSALRRLAQWDGSRWSPVSAGGLNGMASDAFGGEILMLETVEFQGQRRLYAGGDIATIGDSYPQDLAAFDGSSWSSLPGADGSKPPTRGRAIEVFDDGGGPLLAVGGEKKSHSLEPGLALWDGTTWTGVAETVTESAFEIKALEAMDLGDGPRLFVGGLLRDLGGDYVSGLAEWDGEQLQPHAPALSGSLQGDIHALLAYDDGGGTALFAGGSFSPSGKLLRFDGASWSEAAGGTPSSSVLAMAVFDDGGGPALYIGGNFSTIILPSGERTTVNRVAKWDGQAFHPLADAGGVGVDGGVTSLAVVDAGDGEKLYVGGEFTHAGGVLAPQLASWDGNRWAAVAGSNSQGFRKQSSLAAPAALAAYDDGGGAHLYVGGAFTLIYGQRSVGIGRYSALPQIFADDFESGDTSQWSGQ